jgi:hypothetical protein
MSTIVSPQPPSGKTPQIMTVAEYHHLIDTGVLTEDDKVELLEGRIVPKMPRNPPHDTSLDITNEKIKEVLPHGFRLRVQSAITLADSEPEPDLVVAKGSPRTFSTRHPNPFDIRTLIEVSDSTLVIDRRDKGRIYARANIGCYWIINLVDRQIEVYTDPDPHAATPHYRQRQDYVVGQSVPLILDGQIVVQLPVQDLLP